MKKLILALSLSAALFMHTAALAQNIEISPSETGITLWQGFSGKVSISTTPEFIETGIDCGMPEMCGINPCTCGSADKWGYCSCNGTKETYPEITVSSDDNSIASAEYKNGVVTVYGHNSGASALTVKASLEHYEPSSLNIQVKVTPVPMQIYIYSGMSILSFIFIFILGLYFFKLKRDDNEKD